MSDDYFERIVEEVVDANYCTKSPQTKDTNEMMAKYYQVMEDDVFKKLRDERRKVPLP